MCPVCKSFMPDGLLHWGTNAVYQTSWECVAGIVVYGLPGTTDICSLPTPWGYVHFSSQFLVDKQLVTRGALSTKSKTTDGCRTTLTVVKHMHNG